MKSDLFSQEKPEVVVNKDQTKKSKSRTSGDASVVFHTQMVDTWILAYSTQTGITPILVPKEMRNLKLIRQALYRMTGEDTPKVFEQIVMNWHKLPAWYQASFTLSMLYCKINEILNILKNGLTSSNTAPRVTSDGLNQKLGNYYSSK